jgi:hypothetical protein
VETRILFSYFYFNGNIESLQDHRECLARGLAGAALRIARPTRHKSFTKLPHRRHLRFR